MDILRKIFDQKNQNKNAEGESGVTAKDEFHKSQWFEDNLADDELFDDDREFAFQIFTNPMELHKHFETQMQQILEAVGALENSEIPFEKNLKDEHLQPGFGIEALKEFQKRKTQRFDTDLDGEIFADQLKSLIPRVAIGEKFEENLPAASEKSDKILPRNGKRATPILKPKLTDEEIIMGRIHGTLDSEGQEVYKRNWPFMPRSRTDLNSVSPILPRSSIHRGIFDGTYQGPKMFSQSVVMKTVRKPDGSYETTKVTQDSSGNKTTTVTRSTKDGKTETVTNYDGNDSNAETDLHKGNPEEALTQSGTERNIFVSKDGYALPKNLWC